MIDLHSHILPELDDGSHSLQESLVMARIAVDSGVTAMAATPHCKEARAREVFDAWKILREHGIELDAESVLTRADAAQVIYQVSLLAPDAPGTIALRIAQ